MKLHNLFESVEKKTHQGKEDLPMSYSHFNPDVPDGAVVHYDRATRTTYHHAILSILLSKSGDYNWQVSIPHDPPIPESLGSKMQDFNTEYQRLLVSLPHFRKDEIREDKIEELENSFDKLISELRTCFTHAELYGDKTLAYYRNHMLKTIEAFKDVSQQTIYKRSGKVESHSPDEDILKHLYGDDIASEMADWLRNIPRPTLYHFADKKYDFIVTGKSDLGKLIPVARISALPRKQTINNLLAIPGSEDFYFDNWDDIVNVSSSLSYPMDKLTIAWLKQRFDAICKPNKTWPEGYQKSFKEFFLDFFFAKSFASAKEQTTIDQQLEYRSFVYDVQRVMRE
jgi:hypothetical protein